MPFVLPFAPMRPTCSTHLNLLDLISLLTKSISYEDSLLATFDRLENKEVLYNV
jgi:hypothetical protein